MVKLWDVEHPYYCNEGNYFAVGDQCHSVYKRWQDFHEEQGDDDMDMNLVFRWDWKSPREDDDPDKPIAWAADESYRDSTLLIFFMGQRKGLYRWAEVDVCRADEPQVKEWLFSRYEHLLKLWDPFAAKRPTQ